MMADSEALYQLKSIIFGETLLFPNLECHIQSQGLEGKYSIDNFFCWHFVSVHLQ